MSEGAQGVQRRHALQLVTGGYSSPDRALGDKLRSSTTVAHIQNYCAMQLAVADFFFFENFMSTVFM